MNEDARIIKASLSGCTCIDHEDGLAALARISAALEAAEADARQAEAVVKAAQKWVKTYDAPAKTATAWSFDMQRLRIALIEYEEARMALGRA